MSFNAFKFFVCLLPLSMAAHGASARLTLPAFFTDNMIVQQNSTLTVPVTTLPGRNVKVLASWGAEATGRADADGRAEIKIATPEAGGPYSLTVSSGPDSLKLINLLSGEVWLCSGQSNMEFPVKGWTSVMNDDDVIGRAHCPDIRLLQIKDVTAFTPQHDTEVTMGGWVECNPATMQDFSAIAYMFADRIHSELGVPVGVIDCAWGGTPAEAWTSAEALGAVAGFETELGMLARAGDNRQKLESLWQQNRDSLIARAMSSIKPFDKARLQTQWQSFPVPGNWENNVAPGLDGVVFVQTSVNLTPEEAAGEVELHLGPVDDEDITYVNGREVARGQGFATDRVYRIEPHCLMPGDNVITIQITDNGGEGGFNGNPDQLFLKTDKRNISLAGEWKFNIGADFRTLGRLPADVGGSSFPSVLYNAMLSPLHVMPVKGVLWYQGCANVGRAGQYEPLFQALINNWRELWGYEMPFYFVQLAGWLQPRALQPDSEWAALRNAQAKALGLPNTSMVSAIDLGNPADIHPRNKQEVARRLAETALARNYGLTYDYTAPCPVAFTPDGNKLSVRFDKAVRPRSVAVTGFIVGDGKGRFAVATGRLTAPDTIELTAAEITSPTVARYNWADYPGGNLYGENCLPVAPFASDR